VQQVELGNQVVPVVVVHLELPLTEVLVAQVQLDLHQQVQGVVQEELESNIPSQERQRIMQVEVGVGHLQRQVVQEEGVLAAVQTGVV
jgi:hypothetical protein